MLSRGDDLIPQNKCRCYTLSLGAIHGHMTGIPIALFLEAYSFLVHKLIYIHLQTKAYVRIHQRCLPMRQCIGKHVGKEFQTVAITCKSKLEVLCSLNRQVHVYLQRPGDCAK